MLAEGGAFYAKGAAAGNIDPRYGLQVLRADGRPSQLLRPDQLQQAPSLVIAPCLIPDQLQLTFPLAHSPPHPSSPETSCTRALALAYLTLACLKPSPSSP